jgi:hypothetical protein
MRLALVGALGAVQADVDEVGGGLERRLLVRELIQAERQVTHGERLQDLGLEPGGSRNSKA